MRITCEHRDEMGIWSPVEIVVPFLGQKKGQKNIAAVWSSDLIVGIGCGNILESCTDLGGGTCRVLLGLSGVVMIEMMMMMMIEMMMMM